MRAPASRSTSASVRANSAKNIGSADAVLIRTLAPAISAIAISWIPAPATLPAAMNPIVFGLSEVGRAAVPAINFSASLVNGFSSASIELSSSATEYPAERAIDAIASRRRA